MLLQKVTEPRYKSFPPCLAIVLMVMRPEKAGSRPSPHYFLFLILRQQVLSRGHPKYFL